VTGILFIGHTKTQGGENAQDGTISIPGMLEVIDSWFAWEMAHYLVPMQ
jgi:hypothetical protein